MKKKILILICSVCFCLNALGSLAEEVSSEPAQDRIKETIILVPAQEMKSILEIEKEGIFVPYEAYRKLYERAKGAFFKRKPAATVPPDSQGPAIIQANYKGTVLGELIKFEATFKILQNKKGPAILPFPLRGVRYQSARLNGKQVQFYHQGETPRVIIPEQGSHDLIVEFLVPVPFREKRGAVSFHIPRALVGDIKIHSDLFYDINLKGLLFHSRRQVGDKVEFFGFIGNKEAIALEINNRHSFGERRVKISSMEKHRIFMEQGLVQHEAEFDLRVRDGAAKGITIGIGKGTQVYNLSGPGISGWRREARSERDALHVSFHVPISSETRFTLKTYQYVEPGQKSFRLKDAFIEDLFERDGYLSLFVASDIRVTIDDVEYLVPSDGSSKGGDHREPFLFYRGYSLFNLQSGLTISVQDAPLHVTCSQINEVSILGQRIHFLSENLLQGLESGTARFTFTFPEDYRVRGVTARINGKEVKAFYDLDSMGNLLIIELARPVSSKDQVEFILDSEQFSDLGPSSRGSRQVAIPKVSYLETEQMTGKLYLSIDNQFLLEEMNMKGYVSSDDAIENPRGESKDMRRLIFEFRTPEPEGILTLTYRKPEKAAQTVSYIAIDKDLLQANAYIKYDISANGQDSFYFAIPRWENMKINITGTNIKEKKKISLEALAEALQLPFPPDLEDHDIWNVLLQKEVMGTYLLGIDYQKKIKEYGAFSDIPLVMPLDVANDEGNIVLEANRDTEIRVKKAGLNDVETYEIPNWPSYKPSSRIIESLRYFTRPFTCEIAVFRREESPLLAALVEGEELTYTITDHSDIFFQFDYTVKKTTLQFFEISLPQGHLLWSASVQGKGIKPRKGNGDVLLLPLPSSDGPVNLRLTGYVPMKAERTVWKSFDFDSPGLTIPSLHSRIRVFLPKDRTLIKTSGNFQNISQTGDQRPVLLSIFQWFGSPFYGLKSLNLLSPFEQKAATGPATSEMVGKAPLSYRMKKGILLEDKMDRPDISEKDSTGSKDRIQGKAQRVPGKKGILSLNIDTPKEGTLLLGDKIWGEGRLGVTLLSTSWKKALSALTVMLFIVLGFYLTRHGFMSPFGFFAVNVIFFTLLPLVFLKPFLFLFNGALIGTGLFVMICWVIRIWGKIGGRQLAGLAILFLLPSILFAADRAFAESEDPFPDIGVYVPYEEEVPFELEDSHEIFIPTKDYFLLKFLAEPPYIKEKDFQYENEHIITGLHLEGQVEGEIVRFKARADIFVNHRQWSLVNLPFSNVFIEEFTLDGKEIPVRIKAHRTAGAGSESMRTDIYEIPVAGFGNHSVEVTFYVEVHNTTGKRGISFGFPECLTADLSLAMKEKEILIEVEEPKEGYYIEKARHGLTVRASLSRESSLKISWFPKKYIKKAERPLIYADCDVSYFLDYEEALVSQKSAIRVEKSSLNALLFEKHPELIVTDVVSHRVKNWKTYDKEGKHVLEVLFKNEVEDTVDILIKARMKVIPGVQVPVVILAPDETERIRGTLNLYGLKDYKVFVENTKDLDVSDRSKGESAASPRFELQRRYTFTGALPEAKVLSIPRERKVHADILGQYVFDENYLTAHITVDLHVIEGFLTSIELRIPDGFRINPFDAEEISDYRLEDNILALHFRRAIRGKYQVTLMFEKDLSRFDRAQIDSIELLKAEKVKGQCMVTFPRGYEVRELNLSQLRPINVNDVSTRLGQVGDGRSGAKYAYKFNEKPFKASYSIIRRKPVIDVMKVYHTRVEDSLINVKVLSLFTIKHAPVYQFDILAPAHIKDSIKIEGEGIKGILKKVGEQGENVRITVQTLSGIVDTYLLVVSFDSYLGKEKVFELPHIQFPQANSRTEFVTVETASAYRVETRGSEALQEIERDAVPAMPAEINLNNLLWAYRVAGVKDWRYVLEVKRLERERLIAAAILREDIKSRIISQGYALHEITLKVNNRVLQFLPIDLPVDAELWSLKVAGEPVGASIAPDPESRDIKRLLVPLIKSSTGDRNFDIKLVYLTPVPKFGLRGKIDMGMVKTVEIPAEKTTWMLYLPENYAYPDIKHDMEEIDITEIEAEKTLELAKEYEYWTNMAATVTGKLKEKALSNRRGTMKDYARQQVVTQQMQSDLDQRLRRVEPADEGLLLDAQSRNATRLDEARRIIEYNRLVSEGMEESEKGQEKQVIPGRKNRQGWQFKSKGFINEGDLEESITGFLKSEDKKREHQKKKAEKTKMLDVQKRLEGARKEVQSQMEPQEAIIGKGDRVISMKPAPSRPFLKEAVVPKQPQPPKKSAFLKGVHAMDIPFPERGIRLSFKKLGGNPAMTLTYRKGGIISSLFFLLFLLIGIAGTLRIRKWRLPEEKIHRFFKERRIKDAYDRFMQSRLVKMIPSLLMIAAIFLGLPWFIIGLGLNTILGLGYVSRKWHEKRGHRPPYGLRMFLKYTLSYIIILSSLVYLITRFHPIFLIPLTIATFLNGLLVILYALVYLIMKRRSKEKHDESDDSLPPQTPDDD